MDLRSHVIQLNENRARVWEEAKGFLDRTEARGGEMNAEEKAQWDRYNQRIADLDAEIKQFVATETRERESAQLRENNLAIFGEARVNRSEAREADEVRAILRGGHDPRTGAKRSLDLPMAAVIRERELLRQGASRDEIRALLWDTTSVGSTVPTSMARTLYEYLEANTAMLKAPTTKINTQSGEPMIFPKLAAHSIATQVIAQGTAIAGTEPTFAKMTLDAYKYGQLILVASEVIEDSNIDVISWLGRDLGRAIGRLVDADLVVGTGVGEPNGIFNAATACGSVVTGGSLIQPTYENYVDTVYSLNDSYRASGSAGWIMKDSTAGVIRKIRDGAGGTVGAAMWEPSLTAGLKDGQPDRFLGYPVYTDPNVAALGSAARAAIFTDFSSYFIRTVGDIKVERDDSFAFNADESAVRAKWRVDGDLIDTSAVVSLRQSVT